MIETIIKTPGEYRKEVYHAIQQVIGRELSPNEHKYLSNLFKDYVASHAPQTRIVYQNLDGKPIVRTYICGKCKKERTIEGKKQRGTREQLDAAADKYENEEKGS